MRKVKLLCSEFILVFYQRFIKNVLLWGTDTHDREDGDNNVLQITLGNEYTFQSKQQNM